MIFFFWYYYRQDFENYITFVDDTIKDKDIEKGVGLNDEENNVDIYINKLDLYLAK
jgi:hypothetical protein